MSVRLPIDIPIWKMKKEVGEENPVDTATVLTGFVRERYLKHLKTLLLKNYATFSSHQDSLRVFTEQDIDRCARELENEALRDCMVVQLYQKSMSSMVKNIKKQTDLLKLHHILENFTVPSTSKETQTETSVIDKTQTQPLPDLIGKLDSSDSVVHKNVLESPGELLIKVKQEPGLDNLEFDLSLVKQEAHLDQDITTMSTPQRVKANPVATSPRRQHTTEPHNFTEIKIPKLEQNVSCQENNDAHLDPLANYEDYPSLDERLATLLGLENSSSVESALGLDAPQSLPTPEYKELDFPYLDDRLAEIFGETNDHEPEVARKRFIRKVTSWSAEKQTNLRMLNSLMTRFSNKKKLHVEHLFYILFEPRRRRRKLPPSNSSVVPACSTGSNIVSEKKRVGRRVVKHLMKFYNTGKISSREQFKLTASQITDALMLKYVLPEEKEIEESVQNFFIKKSAVKK